MTGVNPLDVLLWLQNRVYPSYPWDEEMLGRMLESVRVRDEEAHQLGYFSSVSGAPCYLHAPERSHITINDIATALSRANRWGGRTTCWLPAYNVAQHSVMVSKLCRPKNALVGLMHDATEAYLGDMISPLKKLMPTYRDFESKWALEIGKRFGLGDQLDNLPPDVKIADLIALEVERHDLLERGRMWYEWGSSERPTDLPTIRPCNELDSWSLFMARYDELTKGAK